MQLYQSITTDMNRVKQVSLEGYIDVPSFSIKTGKLVRTYDCGLEKSKEYKSSIETSSFFKAFSTNGV